MKKYQSFEDIDDDLKRLRLERNIALEEIKLLKNEFREDLKPSNWTSLIINATGKYGVFLLLKRFFK